MHLDKIANIAPDLLNINWNLLMEIVDPEKDSDLCTLKEFISGSSAQEVQDSLSRICGLVNSEHAIVDEYLALFVYNGFYFVYDPHDDIDSDDIDCCYMFNGNYLKGRVVQLKECDFLTRLLIAAVENWNHIDKTEFFKQEYKHVTK